MTQTTKIISPEEMDDMFDSLWLFSGFDEKQYSIYAFRSGEFVWEVVIPEYQV